MKKLRKQLKKRRVLMISFIITSILFVITSILFVMLAVSEACSQELVMADTVLIVAEPVDWIDVYDIETDVLLDSIPYIDNAYEFYLRSVNFIGDSLIPSETNYLLGVMSGDDLTIEKKVALTDYGKGKYEFGYRAINLDGSAISPNIHWASSNKTNKWYVNYIPTSFIVRRIRSGSFIGLVIYNNQ